MTPDGLSPAIFAITPANKANTKKGAALITISTIFRKMEFSESTILFIGNDCFSGIMTKTTPKKIAKNIVKQRLKKVLKFFIKIKNKDLDNAK